MADTRLFPWDPEGMSPPLRVLDPRQGIVRSGSCLYGTHNDCSGKTYPAGTHIPRDMATADPPPRMVDCECPCHRMRKR